MFWDFPVFYVRFFGGKPPLGRSAFAKPAAMRHFTTFRSLRLLQPRVREELLRWTAVEFYRPAFLKSILVRSGPHLRAVAPEERSLVVLCSLLRSHGEFPANAVNLVAGVRVGDGSPVSQMLNSSTSIAEACATRTQHVAAHAFVRGISPIW